MTFREFQKFIADGEKPHVDFKETCHAFAGKDVPREVREASKAELAKDICAMANNGNRSSYLLIGVSDDGRRFETVTNQGLTTDRLQDFCKTAIYPSPTVTATRQSWPDAAPEQKGKEFVIVKVGPHTRQAFRLAQDFIVWSQRKCYRRNEVWIRRGTGSDLAAPDEIARLMKGHAPEGPVASSENVVYSRLPVAEQHEALLQDLRRILPEVAASMSGNRIVWSIKKKRYIWRVDVLDKAMTKGSLRDAAYRVWSLEHGLVLISLGGVSESSLPVLPDMRLHETWGWFLSLSSIVGYNWGVFYVPGLGSCAYPANVESSPLALFAISGAKDTDSLRRGLVGIRALIDKDELVRQRIDAAGIGMNNNLRRWIREGWLYPVRHYISAGHHSPKPKPEPCQVVRSDGRGGWVVYARIRNDGDVADMRDIVQLSSHSRKV